MTVQLMSLYLLWFRYTKHWTKSSCDWQDKRTTLL